ncbi:Hypothetical protein PHPALM_17443 [Phytophthora palmivora]|uniref:Uncharacterized protein n=1 Tax=Phytophthora palmivora TaxID=4796 RepID=A0A2P4XM77_9STRA|nr:Hypothetical protein PHPALM_17443 [Phytophthora palmivora]
MLTTAIAEVLTLQPRVPVAFLASHFQGLATNKSVAVVSSLRACHPTSPSFSSAVEKVFYDLAGTEGIPLSNTSSNETLPPRSSSAGPNPSRKVKVGGPTTISETSFLHLLQQLSTDIPKSLQNRLIETILSIPTTANSKEAMSTQGVGLARFYRGVQICLLMEELMDAASLLFQALERSNSDFVTAETLINSLRSAATAQFSQELSTVLAPLLARALTLPESSHSGGAIDTSTPTNRNLLHLNDVYDLLFNLAFVS